MTRRGVPPDATYTFKHALVQDVAYASLLRARRRSIHHAIAITLTRRLQEMGRGDRGDIARHFEAADQVEPAIDNWIAAGMLAAARYANLEAIAHFRNALNLLNAVASKSEPDHRELGLQLSLGNCLIASQGYAAPDAGDAFGRAYELSRALDDPKRLFSILYGVWVYHYIRAELDRAIALGEEVLALAATTQDAVAISVSNRMLGSALYCTGQFEQALRQENAAVAAAALESGRHVDHGHPQNPWVAAKSYEAWALFSLGYPQQAIEAMNAALEYAEDLAHPLTLTYALYHASDLHTRRRDFDSALARAEQLIALAGEQNLAFFHATGLIWKGWALAETAAVETGLSLLTEGLNAFQSTGSVLYVPTYLVGIAQAHLRYGDHTQAINCLDRALSMVEANSERNWEAEIQRVKGTVLMDMGPMEVAESERCFDVALDVATRQNAKSWQLRTATSLARIWQSQAKTKDAHDILFPIHDWFTEGFETKDLSDAKALLEELR